MQFVQTTINVQPSLFYDYPLHGLYGKIPFAREWQKKSKSDKKIRFVALSRCDYRYIVLGSITSTRK